MNTAQLFRRIAPGVLAAAGVVAVGAVMLPLRAHIAIATAALVLVVPVVVAVAAGGPVPGLVAVVAAFLVYDFWFIPPYGTLSVGSAQNWAALGVYVVVLAVMTRVVVVLRDLRADAARHEAAARRMLEVTDVLLAEESFEQLAGSVVSSLVEVFELQAATLYLQGPTGLTEIAHAGGPFGEEELAALLPRAGAPRTLDLDQGAGRHALGLPLSVATRGVGLLLLSGFRPAPGDTSSLGTYANQLALVLERRELRARAMRAELLEEVDKLREALMGAVSHDLRTPLASITTAASTLRERGEELAPGDREELVELIESQAQRLARLVSNLLDMTRIASGALELRKEASGLGALLDDALALLPAAVAERVVVSDPDAPLVRVDPVLISQVLANLLENADRHAPAGTPIEVSARRDGDIVEITVDDSGPGVPEGSRDSIFSMFSSGTGGAGVGLAIARSFIEAHGGTIAVGASPSGGARFVMRLPFAALASEVH